MNSKKQLLFVIGLFFIILLPFLIVYEKNLPSNLIKATASKANISFDVNDVLGPLPKNWKAFAQGGEEKGVAMLENVVPQVSELYPRYIRIDHMYDFYDVVKREDNGNLIFNFSSLDKTVCDIYRVGAKPFFSLGYMPETMSSDGSLIGTPKNWDEWALLVQKTVERYSGKNTVICGQIKGSFMEDVYYEVWNEPDLETFGKWTIYSGKDYKTLYLYSEKGAGQAQNVYRYHIGGPVTTALYKNWILRFLDYVSANNLKLDFISWHHYSSNPNDYKNDLINLNSYLTGTYAKYQSLPKIISEWGYDSNPNPISETAVGAAHTIYSIRNLIEEKLEMAFAFEVKDGPEPRWGFLSYTGDKKPRYKALKMLNFLNGQRLHLQGENDYIKAIASRHLNITDVLLVNYDALNTHEEVVPIRITGLANGLYIVETSGMDGIILTESINVTSGVLEKSVYLKPNSIINIQIQK